MPLINVANLGQTLLRHSPAILTAIGVAGVITTGLLSARAAVQIHEVIVDEEHHLGEDLSLSEKFKLTWPYLLPPVLVAGFTITCVIGAQSINSRRNAALMSLYTIADRSLTEIREKTREVIGDKKFEEIQDEIAKERFENLEIDDHWHRKVELRGDGVGLAMDMYSDRVFVSSRNEIDAAVNYVNHEINTDGYCDLNTFYDQIGLGRIPVGEDVGWVMGGLLEVQYTYIPAEDGSPCMAVTFKRQPEHNFHRVWR